jgi:hypothetical protein
MYEYFVSDFSIPNLYWLQWIHVGVSDILSCSNVPSGSNHHPKNDYFLTLTRTTGSETEDVHFVQHRENSPA